MIYETSWRCYHNVRIFPQDAFLFHAKIVLEQDEVSSMKILLQVNITIFSIIINELCGNNCNDWNCVENYCKVKLITPGIQDLSLIFSRLFSLFKFIKS